MNFLLQFHRSFVGGVGVFLLYHSIFYLYDLVQCVYTFLFKESVNESIRSKSTEELRIEKRVQQFKDSFLDKTTNYNENIDPVLYDRETYDQLIQCEENHLEQAWTKRILMEITPRGNCIMRYNVYKLAFEYYADSYIPYALLNTMAMKYVLVYRCRDFFVDEHCLPEGFPSGLTESIHKYEEAKKQKQKQENADKHKNTASSAQLSGPFLRSKATKEKSKEVPNPDKPPNKSDEKSADKRDDKIINKFSYMGKLVNFSMLVKPKKVNQLNGFKTELLADNNLSYEEYKKRKLESQK